MCVSRLPTSGKYSNTESKIVVDAIKTYASANAITVEVSIGGIDGERGD